MIAGILVLSFRAGDASIDASNELGSVGRAPIVNGIHLNGPGINGGSVNGGSVNGGSVNGGSVNGGSVNGGSVNGGSVNGGSVNGGSVNGARLVSAVVAAAATGTGADGAGLSGIRLDGSVITSVRDDGAVLSGAALLGATFSTETAEGAPVDVRIDALESLPARHPGGEIHRYTISYAQRGSADFRPACGERQGSPIRAIPLEGRWDDRQGVPGGGAKIKGGGMITFACEGYALAKCVHLGYVPWLAVDGAPLEAHHEACVRMIRADYCGDGRSWTVDGTLINVYDNFGIQQDTEGWHIESEWGPGGARCLSRRRIQAEGGPSCAFERAGEACGSSPAWGPDATLLVSEAR
jgi:hypothetical protein